MKLHPLLQDPLAVLVVRTPLKAEVGWEDFRTAGTRALAASRIELEQEKALLKPNVTSGERFADPDTGITTHPAFLQGMIEYLARHGARGQATIIEDPRDTDDNDPRHWRGTGYHEVAQATGARLHCPTTYTCVKKDVPNPQAFTRLNVSRLVVAPGAALFNVPKLKTHNLAITTLCLKNLMGLVNVFDRHYCIQAWQELPAEVRDNPRPRAEWLSAAMHERWQDGLARRLADTAQVIRAAFNVVEGVVGREGTGFQRGRNRPLGLAVCGINPVAVDSLASYLMGFDPQRIVYLQVAARVGLGSNVVGDLRVYTEQEGELAACPDVEALRADPPFKVISNIQGEEVPQFDPIPEDFSYTSFAGKTTAKEW